MNQNEYRQILIVDLKKRGYKWETVKKKGGTEIPLSEASVTQLKAIRYQLMNRNNEKLRQQVNQALQKQMEFDFTK